MIQTPNSCGQGFDPDHTLNPYHAAIAAAGFQYSHSTPVTSLDGQKVAHHTYKRDGRAISVCGVRWDCHPNHGVDDISLARFLSRKPTTLAIEHLEASIWKTPDSYGGFSPVGDYVVLSRNRDSRLLDNCNWDVAVESLKAEAMDHGTYYEIPADRPNVYHWRAGHWAVGWVEYLMARADAPDDIKTAAGEILCSLADYPILDEERYSNAECEAVDKYWAECSVRDRVDYLRDAGLSIFAARRDYLPDDNSGSLFERLREGL